MPNERRNRMRSLSSDGLLKKSSTRPAAADGDDDGKMPSRIIFAVIAIETVGVQINSESKSEKLSIASNHLDKCDGGVITM